MNKSDGVNVEKKERATQQLREKQSQMLEHQQGGLSRPEGIYSTFKFYMINVSLSLKFSKHNHFLF